MEQSMIIRQRTKPLPFSKRDDLSWEEIKGRDGVYQVVRMDKCCWYFISYKGTVYVISKWRLSDAKQRYLWKFNIDKAVEGWKDYNFKWISKLPERTKK